MRRFCNWAGCALALLAVACSSDTGDHALTVVVRQGAEAEGIRALAAEWQQVSGNAVEVISDVLFFPSTLIPEMAEKGLLAPVDRSVVADPEDLLVTGEYQGDLYGLPTDVSTFFTFFRADLVAQPPALWSDLLAAARRADLGGNVVFSGKAGEELPKMFYPLLWSSGGFVLRGDSVGLDTPEAIAAASMFQELAMSPMAPPDLSNWDVVKVLDELQAGSVAIAAPQWNALFPLIKGGDSQFAEAIAIAPLPGVPDGDSIRRTNFVQSWMLVKSRGAPAATADEFIAFATGPAGAHRYALEADGTPARVSVLADSAVVAVRPEFPAVRDALEHAQAEPAVPFYAELHAIMNDHLSELIAGAGTAEDIMRAAAADVRDLVSRTRTSGR